MLFHIFAQMILSAYDMMKEAIYYFLDISMYENVLVFETINDFLYKHAMPSGFTIHAFIYVYVKKIVSI